MCSACVYDAKQIDCVCFCNPQNHPNHRNNGLSLFRLPTLIALLLPFSGLLIFLAWTWLALETAKLTRTANKTYMLVLFQFVLCEEEEWTMGKPVKDLLHMAKSQIKMSAMH